MTIIDMAIKHAKSTYGATADSTWHVFFSDGDCRIGKIHSMGDFCFSVITEDLPVVYCNPTQVTRLFPLREKTDVFVRGLDRPVEEVAG